MYINQNNIDNPKYKKENGFVPAKDLRSGSTKTWFWSKEECLGIMHKQLRARKEIPDELITNAMVDKVWKYWGYEMGRTDETNPWVRHNAFSLASRVAYIWNWDKWPMSNYKKFIAFPDEILDKFVVNNITLTDKELQLFVKFFYALHTDKHPYSYFINPVVSYDVRDEIHSLEEVPGVYIIYDSLKNRSYIGKANDLAARAMVSYTQWQGSYLSYIICKDEMHALSTERELICRERPKLNTLIEQKESNPDYIIPHESKILDLGGMSYNKEWIDPVLIAERKVKVRELRAKEEADKKRAEVLDE